MSAPVLIDLGAAKGSEYIGWCLKKSMLAALAGDDNNKQAAMNGFIDPQCRRSDLRQRI